MVTMDRQENRESLALPVDGAELRHARLWNGVVAFLGTTVVGLAGVLSPDPSGMGTHQRLGLPPCTMLQYTGIPCPFCGMTTSFSHMAHGQPLQAAQAQPMGVVLFLLTVAAVMFFLWRSLAGHPESPDRVLSQIPRWAIPWILFAFTGAWIYKVFTVLAA
jgi:hypothetical protein